MLRRNVDAIAIAIAVFLMALAAHIPPPGAATARVVRFENPVFDHARAQGRCPIMDRILSALDY